MNLEKIKKTFDERHDFVGEDIELLKERYPWVEINNIPVAWVLPIDEMLCQFRYTLAVTKVEQHYGQLCVSLKNRSEDQGRKEKYKAIIKTCEEIIRDIDADLDLG